ncbi:MAG: YggS family pyridoxal phosphate-dependent enzyme [Bacteroidetes bacterium]|nr:MAG: YggS family pyridoxal phosphate-dependent enzyme [Bacteroidota bacterium]
MTDITGNIVGLKKQIPASVKLVAVSKTRSVIDILEAYNAGQRCFGENRVQELLIKKDLLPDDIEWHLIGHLQTNKVKSIVPFVSMIQSIDSFKLLSAVNYEASKINRVVDCLLEIHIAMEETKSGFSMNELVEMFGMQEFKNLGNIRICGIMGMATYTSDKEQVRKEFAFLADCFRTLGKSYFKGIPHFKEISMGMSGDYETALKEGSTIIRIGTKIFGERILK